MIVNEKNDMGFGGINLKIHFKFYITLAFLFIFHWAKDSDGALFGDKIMLNRQKTSNSIPKHFQILLRTSQKKDERIGRCKCPPLPSLSERFKDSYFVMKAALLKISIDDNLTRGGSIPQFRTALYTVKILDVFKNPVKNIGDTIHIQSFTHPDVCGILLKQFRAYYFFLENPESISPASHWSQKIFKISLCTKPWEWTDITRKGLKTLS